MAGRSAVELAARRRFVVTWFACNAPGVSTYWHNSNNGDGLNGEQSLALAAAVERRSRRGKGRRSTPSTRPPPSPTRSAGSTTTRGVRSDEIGRQHDYVPVITPFQGNRTQGAMRIDLPPIGDASATIAYASQALGLVCRLEGVTGIAAAIYTDGDEALHAPLAADLSAVCDMIGLDVAALLYSTPNAWGEYFSEAHTGPAPTVDNAPALVAGDQHAGIELPATDAALAAAVAAATFPTDDDATVTALVEDALALDVDAPEPSTLAHLAAVMAIPALLDAALIQWASDEQTGREAVAAQTA